MGHEKVDAALKANRAHQAALIKYVEYLQNELETVDSLLAIVDADEDTGSSSESEAEDNVWVNVPGAVKPTSLLHPRELLAEGGPFASDASWKRNYEELTNHNPMKSREHEVLREAVRLENRRLHALRSDSEFTQATEELTAHPPEFFEQNTAGLDFRRIAHTVNDMIPSGVKRSALECEIRWRGFLHPTFNHGPWSPDERTQLHRLVADTKGIAEASDWAAIAVKLDTGRTPIDCMRRAVTRRQHAWSKVADSALREAVGIYGLNNWQLVAMHVSEDATAHQCQKRFADTLDPSVRGGPWTTEEDERLLRAIAAFSSEGIKSRTSPDIDSPSQCDVEAIQAVDDNVRAATAALEKGKRDTKPDKGKYREKVQVSWQDVALFVPGRTNNQCRERYERVLMRGGELPKQRAGGRRRGEVGKSTKTTAAGAKRDNNEKKTLVNSRSRVSTPSSADAELDDKEDNTAQSIALQPPVAGGSASGQSRKVMFALDASREVQPAQKRSQPRPRPRRKKIITEPENTPSSEQASSSSRMSLPSTIAPASVTPTETGPSLRSTSHQLDPSPPIPKASQARPKALPRRSHADSRKRKRTSTTESSGDEDENSNDGALKISNAPSTPGRDPAKSVNATGSSPSGVRRSSRIAIAAGRV